jgi:hypothetical protein
MKPRYLTKSRFVSAIECPTKLFYLGKKEYRNINNEDSFLASLAKGGYQVGALAKFLFKNGVEVFSKDHEQSVNETSELLNQENVVIYEAAIKFNNFFVRVDILEKNGDKLKIYEAKAKSFDSLSPDLEGARGGITKEYLPYLQDVTFQTWVLKQKFPNSEITSFLVMPDKSKLSRVERLNQMFKIDRNNKVSAAIPENIDIYEEAHNLLAKVCVDSLVNRIINEPLKHPGAASKFDDAAEAWAKAYADDIKIPAYIGKQCKDCEFKSELGNELLSGFHECWKQTLNWGDRDFNDPLVLDLYKSKRKDEYIGKGLYKLKQLTREDFKDFDDEPGVSGLSEIQRQWLQVNGIPADYDEGGFYFDKAFYQNQKSRWTYPFHLIDFETTKAALPFYEKMRPYQSIAFQFSHHILDQEGNVKHFDEFICVDPGDFPSYKFVRALMNSLSNDDGTIFRWSHHENTILNGIFEDLAKDPKAPDDKEELMTFIKKITKSGEREMIDLCDISSKCFYHEFTKGRNSLKVVLPALFIASPFLRDTYSKAIYGHPNGIPSFNFKSDKGFIWFDPKSNNYDPYVILKSLAYDLLPENIDEFVEENSSIIAEGGAAAMAYARLQYEDINSDERTKIKESLLRYCELDTLAMAMVVQAWDHI